MDNINNWSANNNLCLNSKKTKMMVFSTRQLSKFHKLDQLNTTIKSNNQELEQVKSFKILGVHFNENLDWKNHINIVSKNCYATLKALKQLKNSANWNLRKILVEALVLSKINYCNLLLSDAPKYQLKRLQKIQNAAAGFVYKRHANIQDVLNLRWLPVEESIDSALAKAGHKAIHDENWPSYLRLSLVVPSTKHLRSMKDSSFKIDAYRALNGSFAHNSARCFNDLPESIRKIETKLKFNAECYKYYFDKATAKSYSIY